MTDKVTIPMTVTAHPPGRLVCAWGLEIVSIDSFHVTVRLDKQEITLQQGNTLELRATIDRKDIAGLLDATLLQSIEDVLHKAKNNPRAKSWFWNRND